MVTHDRYFLDKVSNRILEISHGKMYSYDANYTTFLELKAQREEMELASERKRQSILRMELEWAKRGCRASEYGGAPLLGLNGLVVKTHGSSTSKEVCNSIIQCVTFKNQQINEKIRESIQSAQEEKKED